MASTKLAEPDEDVVETSKREMEKRNPISRIGLFFRQVGQELRKVVTPTGRELLTYTFTVLAFVLFMMLIVTLLDFLFGFGASWLFGNGQELFPTEPEFTNAPTDPATPAGDPAAPAQPDPAATAPADPNAGNPAATEAPANQ